MIIVSKIPVERLRDCHQSIEAHKNIFVCLLIVHDIMSTLCHERKCVTRLSLERCFSHPQAPRWEKHLPYVAPLKKFVNDMIFSL